MENVVSKRCLAAGCNKTMPSYGLVWKKPTHCATHGKLEGMENVVAKRCLAEGCDKQPNYGLEWNKPTHCASCKLEGMENVVDKRCLAEGCKKQPSYGLVWKKPTHCASCKLEGMENVVDKRCLIEGCNKRPSFGLIWKKPTHCGNCRLDGMEDVINKRCLAEGCDTQPCFGLVWGKPTHCATHGKKEDMENVVAKRCLAEGCTKQPNNGLVWKKPTHCGNCKLDGMEDVVHERCLTPYCETYPSNTAYDGYCLRCFMYTFPDRKVARNYKTKEQAIVDHVQEHFPEFTWITDKRISDGCSLRRPDLLVDFGSHVAVVEVDEDQHQGYDCSCENKRLMELSKDVGHRPLVFIRFNPDKYVDGCGTRVDSCWKKGTDGIVKLSNSDRVDWDQRLTVLSNQIEYWTKNKTLKMVEVVELFYDGWRE